MKLLAALTTLLLLAGCDTSRNPAGEKVLSTDAGVDQATADRLAGILLRKVPAIRAEHAKRREGGAAVQLVVRVEHGPQAEYTGPDKPLHREYYWLYVGFHGAGGILKTYRYLVHRESEEVLVYDEARDAFAPPA